MHSVVARFTSVGEAESARSALEAAGIEAWTADEHIVGVDWLSSNAVGGVKLCVRGEARDDAFAILATAAKEATESDVVESPVASNTAEPSDDTQHCPSCGSADVRRIRRLMLFAALAVITYGVGVAIGQPALALAGVLAVGLIALVTHSHRCGSCGERWNGADIVEDAGEAPPPLASDTVEERCRRCSSLEFYSVRYRRLRVLPMR